MALFRFELRKLLFNKKTLIILAVLLVLYIAVGFGTSYFLIGSGNNYEVYSELAEPHEGQLDPEMEAQALEAYEEIKERFGDNPEVIHRSIADMPELRFEVDYAELAGYVVDYYTGTAPESAEEPYGLAVLQDILTQMEQEGKTGTFGYKAVSQQLAIEKELGAPEYAVVLLWSNLFNNWGEHVMQFLLFVPLAFVIAPVFSVEAATGMDNIILSSRNGRKKIVTAKIWSAVVAALVVVGIYIAATFAFGFISMGTMQGWDAAMRCLPTYVRAPYGFNNLQFAAVAAGWLLFTGTVYAMITAFISSRVKSQMATVGISLAVLFVNVGLASLGSAITQMIQPIIDFGLANVTLVKEVFGEYKVFNVFGLPVPYPIMALIVLGGVSALAIFGAYWGQKRRTVA